MREDKALSFFSFDNDSVGVTGLEKLIKALHQKPPVARVGILGDNTRTRAEGDKSPPTNAEVGAAHEFGTSSIPRRSFLRVPIADGLQGEMERSGLLDQKALKEVIKQGSVLPWMEKVAVCAEACVLEAFDTGGNGKWPAWKDPGYMNNAGQLLVDTKQLRQSISTEVKQS